MLFFPPCFKTSFVARFVPFTIKLWFMVNFDGSLKYHIIYVFNIIASLMIYGLFAIFKWLEFTLMTRIWVSIVYDLISPLFCLSHVLQSFYELCQFVSYVWFLINTILSHVSDFDICHFTIIHAFWIAIIVSCFMYWLLSDFCD